MAGMEGCTKVWRFGQKAALVSCLLTTQAFGWGGVGHQIVGEVGARLAEGPDAFWGANEQSIGTLANVPDRYWKSGKTGALEKPTHFFEPDGYFNNPADFFNFPRRYADAVQKYGEASINAHGTAVWRIQQLADLAASALAGRNFKSAIEMAGAMSHYVGDLSQPLHLTVNYDGQMTEQTGIHKFFETTNLDKRDYTQLKNEVIKRAQKLLADKTFRQANSGKLESVVFNSIDRSYDLLNDVLDIDKKSGRSGVGASQQLEIAYDRLADGAATLAVILARLWQMSPDPNFGQTVAITTPAWVRPDYSTLSGRARARRLKEYSFFKGAGADQTVTAATSDCY